MKYFGTVLSDIGIKKDTNQDCAAIKIVDTPKGQVAFLIVCDGMGGLEKGELASATVITEFLSWFENRLPVIYTEKISIDILKSDWEECIKSLNDRITRYSSAYSIRMGTTLTAMLMIDDKYYIVHVGDCRVYRILKGKVQQITADQTFVARQIREGRMTAKEAANDKRRNMLLQCIGASQVVIPEYYEGNIDKDAVYFVCSDGFRHMINDEEMAKRLDSSVNDNADNLREHMKELIDINKQRRETDNMSVVAVKTT